MIKSSSRLRGRLWGCCVGGREAWPWFEFDGEGGGQAGEGKLQEVNGERVEDEEAEDRMNLMEGRETRQAVSVGARMARDGVSKIIN